MIYLKASCNKKNSKHSNVEKQQSSVVNSEGRHKYDFDHGKL